MRHTGKIQINSHEKEDKSTYYEIDMKEDIFSLHESFILEQDNSIIDHIEFLIAYLKNVKDAFKEKKEKIDLEKYEAWEKLGIADGIHAKYEKLQENEKGQK